MNKACIIVALLILLISLSGSVIATPTSAYGVQAPHSPKLTPEQACANITKSDKPLLEAFVVSNCRFCLQMQRILADIINESKDVKAYVKVMYVGNASNGIIKSLHGDKEAQENLRQICIREEQGSKYWDYLRCYIKEGKSNDCQKQVSLDIDRLNSCTSDSSRGLAYAQKDFDLANKSNVTSEPTLIMSDNVVHESDFATNVINSRSPEALKELLCCGFKVQPSFCSRPMNRSKAAIGFSKN